MPPPITNYTRTLLCFLQLFIVSNRDRTYYLANNNTRHFAFTSLFESSIASGMSGSISNLALAA